MKTANLEMIIGEFKSKSEPTDRYTSFDYYYNYFKTTENLKTATSPSYSTLGKMPLKIMTK